MVRILSLLIGILGAVGTSQAPEFTQQYMQNLKGGVDRLEEVVARFDEDALRSDMSREDALAFCLADQRQKGSMSCLGRAEDVAAHERYSAQLRELQRADDWRRPIYLARNVDRGVAESTLEGYALAIPATPVGAGYAAAGFALLWGIAAMIFGLLTMPFRRAAY
jgi:hypothetical protein